MIKRCIQLAYNGLGTTYPNPLVGCVIVHDGKIIGEGWHQKAGEPHAEVRAIASVKDKSLLAESTLYVSLEPCSHYGKTPPCADLIIAHRIPRVVIGTTDPFAKVAGRGIEKLRAAGCVGNSTNVFLPFTRKNALISSSNGQKPPTVLSLLLTKIRLPLSGLPMFIHAKKYTKCAVKNKLY